MRSGKEANCPMAFDHEPDTFCESCKLEVDSYGNTENDFLNCSFPDCGCDGARLCMAGRANENAQKCNVEGMYERNDKQAKIAKMELLSICLDRK